jgi:hypothetical protein
MEDKRADSQIEQKEKKPPDELSIKELREYTELLSRKS